MTTLLVVFAGLALLVSGCVIALAIYTRPSWEDKRCHRCLHYWVGVNPDTNLIDRQVCRARPPGPGEDCQSQRMPAPQWVPIAFTGRCGPRGRFFVPR
jgi:hypothetical protein